MFTCCTSGVEIPKHLPPKEAWKVDPDKLAPFYAPVDDRGFVMPDATVEVISELFVDDYKWPVDYRFQQTTPDVHHFQWIHEWYLPSNFNGSNYPERFRELPTRKGYLPRQFHNVIHAVTLPPEMPRYDDMKRHVDAYSLAKRLFKSAVRAADIQEQFRDADDEIAREILVDQFERQFKGYQMALGEFAVSALFEIFMAEDDKILKRKPVEMRKKLEPIVANSPINFLREIDHVALIA